MSAALTSSRPLDGLSGGARTRAMFAVGLSVLLSTLDYAVANVALPVIARDIHADAAASIWVINAYQLSSLIGLLPLAAAGNRIGAARLCRIGLVLFAIASLLCAASTTLPELAAARALQGLGGACILSVNAALIRTIYPAKLLGRGIGLNGSILAFGVALGPSVAAGVLAVASWPYLFLINLPLGGLAFFFAITALPDTPISGGKFDYPGSLLLALGLGGLVAGLDSFAHHNGVKLAISLLAVGAAALALLLHRQKAKADKLLPVDLLARPGFRAAFLTGFCGFIASNFFIISIPFHLVNELHRSPVATGLIMTPWAAAVGLAAPFVGRLSDRYPASLLSTLGLGITGTAFVLLLLLPQDPGNFEIAWRIGLAGAGFGLFLPPNNKAMLTTAPLARTGSASGMISVVRLFGQTMGAMLVALTLALLPSGGTSACLVLAAFTAFLAASISATRLRRAAKH